MKKLSKTAHLPPGTAVHVGERLTDRPLITVFDYTEQSFEERKDVSVDDCLPYRDKESVTWINVEGVHEVGLLEALGRHYGIHPLMIEDIANTGARPKFEDLDGLLFVTLKMLRCCGARGETESEHVSLVVGPNFVLSFQEGRPGDVFGSIRERIRQGKGRIRGLGADYLAYSLIDAVVDGYFAVLEGVGDRIEVIEDEVIRDPSSKTLHAIQALRGELIFLRRAVWPLREVIGALARSESKLIREQTGLYIRNVHDHAVQVIDTIEMLREMLSGMLETYLSSLSNRLNEVMKVLTIIATIFIPLTFIAGVYGMNFKYMPEIGWRWGYASVWAVMLAAAGVMLYCFRRKKWI